MQKKKMEEHTRFHFSPLKGIFFTIVLLTLGLILFFAFATIITSLASGHWGIPGSLDNNYLNSLRIMQISQTIGMFIFPAVVMAFLSSKKPWRWLGFQPMIKKEALLAIVIMIAFIPGINLIAELNGMIPVPQWMIDLEKSAEQTLKSLLITDSFSIFSINLLMVGILPAIGEELFFRSLLQKYFIQATKNPHWGVFITSFIFSAIHMQFLGFIPRLLMGMAFGYIYLWTGTILIPMLMHFVNNSMAVVLYYMVGLGQLPIDIEEIGSSSQGWVLGVISLVVGGYLLKIIHKKTTTRLAQFDQTVEVP